MHMNSKMKPIKPIIGIVLAFCFFLTCGLLTTSYADDQKWTVTFTDEGTLLSSSSLPEGDVPEYTPPDKEGYWFWGWKDMKAIAYYPKEDSLPRLWQNTNYEAVYKRKVTITAKDAEKAYDGTALMQSEFDVAGQEDSDTHKFTVVMTADSTITEVGERANVIATVDGVSVNTKDYTVVGDYYVKAANGTLTVEKNKSPLVITSATKSWTYNGANHKEETYRVSFGGNKVEPADESGKVFQLSTGDTLTITPLAKGVTDYSENYSENNTFSYVLEHDTFYNDITANYGTLSIDKCQVTVEITGKSNTTPYNGGEQSVEGYDFKSSDVLYTEDDFSFSGEAIAAGTNAGIYEMGLLEKDFGNTNDNFDVAFNIVKDGLLTIEPKEAAIEWTDTKIPYDGKEHKPKATITNLVNGDECEITVEGAGKEPGTYTATATKISNNNYKLPEKCSTTFEIRGCTITFVDSDGNVLQTVVVPLGEKPEYTGKTPAKKATEKYTYTFSGWDPEIAEATGDATYTAQFKAEKVEKKPVYTVTKGGNGTWTSGSGQTYSITIRRNPENDRCFKLFESVSIDGKKLDGGYSAESGSTVITLDAKTLEALSEGRHTVTVSFEDGKVETTLTVKKADTPSPQPKTGDMGGIRLWMTLFFLSALLLCVLGIISRKRNDSADTDK